MGVGFTSGTGLQRVCALVCSPGVGGCRLLKPEMASTRLLSPWIASTHPPRRSSCLARKGFLQRSVSRHPHLHQHPCCGTPHLTQDGPYSSESEPLPAAADASRGHAQELDERRGRIRDRPKERCPRPIRRALLGVVREGEAGTDTPRHRNMCFIACERASTRNDDAHALSGRRGYTTLRHAYAHKAGIFS